MTCSLGSPKHERPGGRARPLGTLPFPIGIYAMQLHYTRLEPVAEAELTAGGGIQTLPLPPRTFLTPHVPDFPPLSDALCPVSYTVVAAPGGLEKLPRDRDGRGTALFQRHHLFSSRTRPAPLGPAPPRRASSEVRALSPVSRMPRQQASWRSLVALPSTRRARGRAGTQTAHAASLASGACRYNQAPVEFNTENSRGACTPPHSASRGLIALC